MGDDESASRHEPESLPLHGPKSYNFPQTPDALLPWSHALERLERAHSYWLATTRPDGRPHVTPLWGTWIDNTLYFDGLPTTQWARNVAKNPSAAVHLESGDDVVILEGTVDTLETSAELGTRIVAVWDAKYGRLHPNPAKYPIFRFTPRTARGWSTSSLADGTRWQFDEG